MKNYLQYLSHIMDHGVDKKDRTGVGTRSVFGYQMRWNLQDGFPLVTTKKVYLKGVIAELLWFLSGSTNIKPLVDQGVHIWDAWADEHGGLGPVYGAQWRSWPGFKMKPGFNLVEHADGSTTHFDAKVNLRRIDQIAQVLGSLKNNPDSRRHLVTAWNPADVDDAALPPCHLLFQFNVRPLQQLAGQDPVHVLDCQLYQRSADSFLGVPFNVASYSLLTMMVAQQLGYVPGDFIWTGGDCHIYHNHFDQVKEQLTREPYALPTMQITKAASLFDYTLENFNLLDYQHHPAIKADVAV